MKPYTKMARCNIAGVMQIIARHRRLSVIAFLMVSWFIFAGNNLILSSPRRTPSAVYASLFAGNLGGKSSVLGLETRLTKHIKDLETDLNNYQQQVGVYKKSVDRLHVEAMEPNIRRLMDIKQFKLPGNIREGTLSPLLQQIERESIRAGSYVGCSDLSNTSNKEWLGMGNTKYVERGEYNGKEFAIKSVALTGHDMNECIERYMSESDCLKLSNYKLLKEIALFTTLKHTNVLKVLGSCLGDVNNQVKVVTELGKPVNIITLLQLTWEDRFRICLGISRLLYHLSTSPMGSLAIHDFKLAQFVTVNGEIKLADIDDIDNEEPGCRTSADCASATSPVTSRNIYIPCVHGRCQYFTEKINIYNSYRFFLSYLLPFDAPATMKPLVQQIINNTGDFKWTAATLHEKMEKCLRLYTSGDYLARNESVPRKTVYRVISGQDLPGKHDYPCLVSHSGNSCTSSAFDVQEAEDICTRDMDCQAFVVTSRKTWSGRSVIYLKNNFTEPEPNPDTTLYVRVT